MHVIIGADIVPTASNRELFSGGNITDLFGDDLLSVLKQADYRIFNLEVPLTDTVTPLPKNGPNLIAPTASVNAMKALGIDLFTLANNHILDQGEQGLASTCRVLEQNGIQFIGVGDRLAEVTTSVIEQINGKSVGIYACAEHEFSIAGIETPGAAPFDPLQTPDEIALLKERCDFLVVLYHGGKECYRYPSPQLQRVCRKLVDKGADLVVCQHTHCIGCEERYHGGTIVYGQGNFLFDRIDNAYWNSGLLIDIREDFEIEYIPIVKAACGVRKADTEQAEAIMNGFYERSREITVGGVIEERYAAFAESMRYQYLLAISGLQKNKLYWFLNKLTHHRFGKWYLYRKYSDRKAMELINFIECEAHNELLLEGLKRMI